VNSIPDRCTGSFARADQRRDVRGYAREGVAAAFPGLVLVVAGNEVNAKVADGKLGDVLGHAEPAHLGAAGRRGACRRSADCGPLAVACPLPPGADKVDCAEGMAILEAMSSHHNFRPGQQNKLVSEPPIAAPDEHAQLVEADQRFQAALGQAIAAGGERIEAVEATVQLKRRTKLPR
jgi:hypothetical protein